MRPLISILVMLVVGVAPATAVPVDGTDSTHGARAGRSSPVAENFEALERAIRTNPAGAGRLIVEASFRQLGTIPAGPGGAFPVADLDGDELDDLLLTDAPGRAEVQTGALATTRYTAVSGLDRSPLWSLSVPGDLTMPLIVDTGGSGIVLAAFTITGHATAGRIELQLQGVSPSGQVRWTRVFAGTYAFSNVWRWDDVPVLQLPVALASGREAVHLDVIDLTMVGGVPEADWYGVTDAFLLDSVTGAEVGRAHDEGVGWVLSHPSGDLDGDGNGDVVFTRSDGSTGPGDIVAYRSSGERLWARSGVRMLGGFYPDVISVGDFTGDGKDDVAVGRQSHGNQANPGVYIFEGTTGEVVSAQMGDFSMRLGDIDDPEDGKPEAEVGIRSINFHIGGDVARQVISFRAVDSEGRTRWKRREVYEMPLQGSGTAHIIWLQSVDLDGDTIPDARHTASYHAADGVEHDTSGVFSGATGERLWSGPVGSALGGSIQGQGQDLLLVTATGGGARVVAQDGATGAPLWTQNVALDGALLENGLGPLVTAGLGDLDGDGWRDVVVNFVIEDPDNPVATVTRSAVLSGENGNPLAS